MDTLEQMELKAWSSGARPEREVRGLINSVERLRGYQAVANTAVSAVENYASLVQEYIDELQAHAADVAAVIEQVSDETQRRVLECKYLDRMTNEQTADALSYCAKSVNRYHAAALESVKTILERRGEWTKII